MNPIKSFFIPAAAVAISCLLLSGCYTRLAMFDDDSADLEPQFLSVDQMTAINEFNQAAIASDPWFGSLFIPVYYPSRISDIRWHAASSVSSHTRSSVSSTTVPGNAVSSPDAATRRESGYQRVTITLPSAVNAVVPSAPRSPQVTSYVPPPTTQPTRSFTPPAPTSSTPAATPPPNSGQSNRSTGATRSGR